MSKPKFSDLTGQVFGRWTVKGLAKKERGTTFWLCICECGGEKVVKRSYLVSGESTSCGCKTKLRPYESAYNLLVINAKRRHLPITLTYEQFLQVIASQECFYCGAEVTWAEYNTNKNGQASNLDRKDSTHGYTKDNLVPCCWRCNDIKSDHFTFEQFVEIGKLIRAWGFPRSVRELPSHLNCPYCPAQTVLQKGFVGEFAEYVCISKHKVFINPKELPKA